MDTSRDIYLAGYEAFERGDFRRARILANRCLASSPPSSYWYAGARGLKCWIATFAGTVEDVEQSAAALLRLDTGKDKPWFDGLALLNLGLARRRAGRTEEAQSLLRRAAERYQAQRLRPEQPAEWQWVLDYFAALSRWAAGGEGEWERYLESLDAVEQNGVLAELAAIARLMLRFAQGERVEKEAKELLDAGVSRTFLVGILVG